MKIESRRLRRRRSRRHKVNVKAADYVTSAALHPGDEITRRINLASRHHGIYLGGGKVGVFPLVESVSVSREARVSLCMFCLTVALSLR